MPTLKQNALVALPFFPEESYQTFRHPAADDVWESLAILSPRDKLVPIIIQRTPAATPSKIYLCAAEAKVALDITLLVGGGSTATIDGKGWFYNSGATLGASECPKVAGTGSNPITWGAPSGDQTIDEFIATYPYVYLDIQIGASRFFSELLYMADVPEFPELTDGCGNFAYVRLEAITACNIGTYFPAELDVNNTVYIKNGGVYAPQYRVDRVVAEDGNGEESPLWVKFKKIYNVTLYCPESVADWAASLVLYRNDGDATLKVHDEHGHLYEAIVENVTVQWPDTLNSIVAEVNLEFSIEAVTQTGCC